MAPSRRRHADFVTCKHCGRDFRAITFLHLRNIHHYEGDHPINDYKRKFRLNWAMCGESRRKLSETRVDFWSKRGKHWTRALVLKEIRKLNRAGRLVPRGQVTVRLYEAGRRLFGTWQAAVEETGLDYEGATGLWRWTPERVVQAIRELAERGVPLSASYVRAHHGTLFNAAVNRFARSWMKAVQAAGFDPTEHRKPRGRWNKQRAESWVLNRSAKKKSLLARAAPADLLGFIYRRLRTTWPAFVESLGIRYPGVKKRRDWTKQKLIEEIRRWKAEGHRLNFRSVATGYPALIHQARKFFSGWDRARAAAQV